jgi:hypothetical protein
LRIVLVEARGRKSATFALPLSKEGGMSEVRLPPEQAEHAAERDVELSAEEREVLERVKQRAERKPRGALWRFGKNPPLCFWWWGY